MGFSAIVAAVEELLIRSSTLCLGSLAVLEASRRPVATSHRELHPKSGTAASSDDPLLAAVRIRLTTGCCSRLSGSPGPDRPLASAVRSAT